MTTRLPTRDQLASILESVRAEPEGPDQAAAIERLEAQLAGLDDPAVDKLTGPDADLEPEPDEEEAAPQPAPAAPSAAPGKPFGKNPNAAAKEPGDDKGKQPEKKPDNKPF